MFTSIFSHPDSTVSDMASGLLNLRQNRTDSMNLNQAIHRIGKCVAQMNDRYEDVVFDEWAIVSVENEQLRLADYTGKRTDFLPRFFEDAGALRNRILTGKYSSGHFEFSHTGVGTGFESFVFLGNDMFLIWNNTAKSMDDIVRNPRWLGAQASFADLTDRLCIDPVVREA